MERLEGELRAEQVADGPQGAAGVGRQRRVGQQVGDHAVGLAHHRDVHRHTGARGLQGEEQRHREKDRMMGGECMCLHVRNGTVGY